MAEIINGLHIDIASDELKTLLLGRLSYHELKVSKYEEQMGKMASIDAELAEEAENIGKYSNTTTAADTIKQSIVKHRDKATYYKFVAKHIVPNATYRLAEADLYRLGIATH